MTFPLKKDKIFAVVALGWWYLSGSAGCAGWRHYLGFQRQASPSGSLSEAGADLSAQRRLGFAGSLGELNYTSFRTDDVLTTEQKLQLHNAVVQYSEDRAGAQVAYTGFKPFKIIAGAGVTAERQL